MHFGGLWNNRDFLKLWAGETISVFGTQLTQLALPLLAIGLLAASPVEMGLLSAASSLPIVLLSLPAGVWVDRVYRRRLMIGTSLGRMLVLGSIPLAALIGGVAMPQLYLVAFFSGSLAVLFDTAYQAYLPSLISRAALVEGNAKMEVSRSVAQLTGPAVAGALVSIIGAPLVIAIDAVSFLATTICVRLIRTPEAIPAAAPQQHNLLATLHEAVSFLFSQPILRTLVLVTGLSNLASGIIFAQHILFMTRTLGFSPVAVGAILAVGGPSAVVGALAVDRLNRRLGIGRTILLGTACFIAGDFSLALASGPPYLVGGMLILSQVLIGVGSPLYKAPGPSGQKRKDAKTQRRKGKYRARSVDRCVSASIVVLDVRSDKIYC